MCQDNFGKDRSERDDELFTRFKDRLLKISDKYGDDEGVRVFKKKLEQATSFRDLSDNS